MNKLLQGIGIFVLFCGLVFVNKPVKIQAAAPDVSWEDQTWSAGTGTTIDLVKNPSPEWLQLLSGGVKAKANTLICHPFRRGSYHWVAEIRQLVNGKWIKQQTTTGWSSTEESFFQACTTTTADGIYALFGYYNGPAEIIPSDVDVCSYSTTNWQIISNSNTLIFIADNLEGVESVSFNVLTTTGDVKIDPLSGSAALHYKSDYRGLLSIYTATGSWESTIKISLPGCTHTFKVNSPAG